MPIANLDYEPARLAMEVNNPVEEKWRVFACQKEPWTVAFIDAIPEGSIFWDIGANVGSYSLIAGHRKLVTVAIEPAFNNYAALCRNLAMNGLLDQALVLCLALGETTRFDWFHYQDTRSGAASHILGGVRKQFFHKQCIPVWAWDELALRLPLPEGRAQYAKIDADGGELLLLKGASHTLAQMIGLMVEMHQEDREETVKLLATAGFRLAKHIEYRDGKPIGHVSYGHFERASG